jgi:hypothetical protein
MLSLAELGRLAKRLCQIGAIRRPGDPSSMHHRRHTARRRAAPPPWGEWARHARYRYWVGVARGRGAFVLQFPTAIASHAWVLAQFGEARRALDGLGEGEQSLERQAASGSSSIAVGLHSLSRPCLLLGRLARHAGWPPAQSNRLRPSSDLRPMP